MPKIGNPVGGPAYKPQWAKDIDAATDTPPGASLEHKQRVLAHQQAQQVKLLGDNVAYRDALRALQVQLIPIRAMPAVRRALSLIDDTLNPKDDLQ